ncbi:uncharacterized protein EI97DRAFT_447674 [Westerdykella ornata]|uniref:Uncharacterized protein n=1 Tax=Westerdykella ornata TaxID=318751 RepID=A0A6A6JTZ2_WESOR|nr:uncharacterized protein EI97DRAFT_447674 [Westerdykella ornata]KAF2280071.1 hypothetical protein EI97DRAFT_447674 [Westerdykella ornata]
MWKRMGRRAEEKQIGNPVLLETTYDQDQLRHIPTVSDAQNAAYQAESFSPPIQTYSYNIYSPHDPRAYQPSGTHSVSPPYGRSSPPQRLDYTKGSATYSTTADISPPSSPEPDDEERDPRKPRRFRSMRDVSPLDESRGQPTTMRSNIPVLRRVPDNTPPRASTQKFWPGKVAPDGKVRWDEYSGEPTSGNAGKAGQVNPLAFAKEAVSLRSHPITSRDTMTGTQMNATRKMAPGLERPGYTGVKPTLVDITFTPREPWKGASGRAEIVQPFRDQPAKQPLNFQRKPEPRAVKGGPRNISSPVASPTGRVPAAADTGPVADGSQAYGAHDDPIKPVVPLKVGRNSPPRSIASPRTPHTPVIPPLASAPSRGPPSSGAYAEPSTNPPVGTQTDQQQSTERNIPKEPATPPGQKISRKSTEEQTPGSTAASKDGPVSRFSWTTYNSSTTYQQSQHSPPPSPPPPLPTSAAALDQQPLPAASSILNRRRPVPPASEKVTARKPLASTTPSPSAQSSTMRTNDPPSPRSPSGFSTKTQKALPRPPTELSAADHVDILEAQMEDLRIRRSNVHRLLQDLNNQAPPNPLITDFKTARMVEKRKKEFEDELAEIRAEEHGVGLRLHRALRKREREDPNAGSAIWVRRVTR